MLKEEGGVAMMMGELFFLLLFVVSFLRRSSHKYVVKNILWKRGRERERENGCDY
jgi:hypothetical protein